MPSFSLWSRPANGSGQIAARHAQTYALALAHEHKHDQRDYYSSHSRSSSYGHNVEHLEFELQNYQELLELQRLREQARKQQELELDLQRQKQKELSCSTNTKNPNAPKGKNGPSRIHIRSPPTSPTSPCSRMTPGSLYLSGAMQK
ncbi:hypothetical protein F503_05909 [Ophiostoma piceae UAMH 11346]|uniref:Uncharacterized protein n=1 Tax=Ophiostoma piceae (strain UAMH 11346) TaxID=1262450 RepID=S3CBD3_OPHP1|nr:hypothetical protein F503_05909 [Ophiostoma piceae UAMH 11346]